MPSFRFLSEHFFSMRITPCVQEKKVECDHIGSQIEYSVPAEHIADKRDADETAVGVHCAVPFDAAVRSVLWADQDGSDDDPDDMAESGGSECQEQPSDQFGIIFGFLVNSQDEAWVYYKEKQVRHGTVALLADKLYLIT